MGWRLGSSRENSKYRASWPTVILPWGANKSSVGSYVPQDLVLTFQMRGAIRALRKLKYLANRKKFKHALRRYDVRDVMESFGAGQADLAIEVKEVKKQMDKIKEGITSFVGLYELNRSKAP